MKKHRLIALLLLLTPLVLFTGCGDEFGTKRLQATTYVYFPQQQPVKVEMQTTAVDYSPSVVFWNTLSQSVAEKALQDLNHQFSKSAFFSVVNDVTKIVAMTFGGEEITTRKRYSNTVTLSFTNENGVVEKTIQTINIPYLEEGKELSVDIEFQTQSYGIVSGIFVYYFYRSI